MDAGDGEECHLALLYRDSSFVVSWLVPISGILDALATENHMEIDGTSRLYDVKKGVNVSEMRY